VNQTNFILAENFFLALGSIIAWLICDKPKLFKLENLKKRLQDLLSVLIQNPIISFFILIIFIGLCYSLFLMIYVPQNLDDILSTYLARVGFWRQYGSFIPWPTSNYNFPQVVFPGNPQILILWTVLFLGNDQFAGLPQFTALIVTLFSLYGICRSLKQPVSLSIFLSFLFVTIPAVALESSTAQTDLMATALFVSGIFLLYYGWKNNIGSILILSGLSFAIGVGTKQTVIFAFPGCLLFLLLLFIRIQENRWKKFWFFIGGLTVFLLLVGAFFYIQNIIFFGRIFGPGNVEDAFTGLASPSGKERFLIGIGNFGQFFVFCFFSEFFSSQMSAFISLNPPLLGNITEFSELITRYGSGTIGIIVTYLIVFHVFPAFPKFKNNKDPLSISLLIMGLYNLLFICFIRHYSESLFRYTVISFALFLPLIGEVNYFSKDQKFHLVVNERLVLTVLVSLFLLSWTLTADRSRSLYNHIAIPGEMKRTDKQLVNLTYYKDTYNEIDNQIPIDASIGLISNDKYPISPLFGKYFTRRLKIIVPKNDGIIRQDENNQMDYLMIDSRLLNNYLKIPSSYQLLFERKDFTFYKLVDK
jgi:4-amino-4-deoxy-L-arabinose transferase-like glycosyltransferase